jgi:hypothetical protein
MRPLVMHSLSWNSRLSMSLYLLAFGFIVPPALRCICCLDVFECADQCVDVWVHMGDFLLQFVVPIHDVICGTGSICVEVVPYLSVTVNPLGCNIVRECSCVCMFAGVSMSSRSLSALNQTSSIKSIVEQLLFIQVVECCHCFCRWLVEQCVGFFSIWLDCNERNNPWR